MDKPNRTDEKEIILKDEFEWFFSEEFTKLRENSKPTDNRESLKKNKEKEQLEPNPEDTSLRKNLPPQIQQEDLDFNNPQITQEEIELVNQKEKCQCRHLTNKPLGVINNKQ